MRLEFIAIDRTTLARSRLYTASALVYAVAESWALIEGESARPSTVYARKTLDIGPLTLRVVDSFTSRAMSLRHLSREMDSPRSRRRATRSSARNVFRAAIDPEALKASEETSHREWPAGS